MDEPWFSVLPTGPAVPLGRLMSSWFPTTGKWGEESLKSCYAIYQRLEKNWISEKTHKYNSDFYKCASSCLVCVCVCVCVCVLVTELCPTLCDPMDCSPPGSSVHEILQARILELVAIPFSRGSCWPGDWTLVSCIAGKFFTTWTTREAPIIISCTYHYIFQEQGKCYLFLYFAGIHTKCQNYLHGA